MELEGSPIKQATFQPGTLKPTNITDQPGVRRRVGKPRVKSVEAGLERLWKLIGRHSRPDSRYSIMNLDNEDHIRELQRAAQTNISDFTHYINSMYKQITYFIQTKYEHYWIIYM